MMVQFLKAIRQGGAQDTGSLQGMCTYREVDLLSAERVGRTHASPVSIQRMLHSEHCCKAETSCFCNHIRIHKQLCINTECTHVSVSRSIYLTIKYHLESIIPFLVNALMTKSIPFPFISMFKFLKNS